MLEILKFKYKKDNDEVSDREVIVINPASHNNLCIEVHDMDSYSVAELKEELEKSREVYNNHVAAVLDRFGRRFKYFSQEKMEVLP